MPGMRRAVRRDDRRMGSGRVSALAAWAGLFLAGVLVGIGAVWVIMRGVKAQ